ncbi:DUF3530 family protein [Cellvibrio mixtus]|uniref:DUF3530 family protein n=1 Tax=Cellvibrio mixtus TaxID=39650 RepID=UPI00058781A5|nr:DUF3530 family protein [Cellvibrio mixtus]
MQPIKRSMPIKNLNVLAYYASAICIGIAFSLTTYAQQPAAADQSSEATASTQSSAASSEPPLYESRDIRDKTLIANAAGEQAQWLDTEYGKLLAFYRPTEAKKTHGVLILFHSAEDPQTWPPILENLRANLPRYGWETLAVTLPQKYPAPIPGRPSPASASSSAATTSEAAPAPAPAASSASAEPASQASSSSSSQIPRDTLIQAYVQATFKFLQDKGQFNAVLLVDNSSANQVLQQLLPQIKENPRDPATIDGPIQALVITNLQNQEPLNTSELTSIFANKQLPVLDVFFNPDDADQTTARDLHRAVAMRQKLDSYIQASLDSQPKIVEDDPRSFLAARVRGFMQRHASGTEVQGASENKAGGQTKP